MAYWIGEIGRALRTTFIGGASLFRLAPVTPLLVIVPEFVQHVVEIWLGMFESRAAFSEGGATALRMGFGFAKVAGLVLAIFAAARYWGGARERWWRLREIPGKQFLIALAINVAVSAAMLAATPLASERNNAVLDPFLTVLTLPLLVMLVGPLLGDATMTLRRAYTSGWIKALAMGLLAVSAFWPMQWLHGINHEWAIGAPAAQVWGLMVFDSLLVGLLACCTGAALAAGYRLGGSGTADADKREAPQPA